MYCKNCGKEIDDDSKFCSQCGTELSGAEKCDKNDDEEHTKDDEKSGYAGCGMVFIILILVLAVILIIGYFVTKYSNDNSDGNNDNNKGNTVNSVVQQITSRDANNGDVEIDSKMNLGNLGIDIIIHPNCDIEGLVIRIKQYGQDGELIEIFDKHLGNVKEGVEITTSISLTDFNISDILNLGKTAIEVYSGRVKYLQ